MLKRNKIMKKSFFYSLALIISVLSIFPLSTHAAATTVQTSLLNTQAGSPSDPRNIKLSITMPESYGKTVFNTEDFNVFIYPQALNIATGRTPEYQAHNILLWQHNNQLFLDIRKPPEQRSGGAHTVYLEISKNKHTIYQEELKQKVNYEDDEVDVVLIIDSSLSMHNNDPYRNRLRAAKAFVDLARSDKRIKNIGIIAFNNKARVIAGLTPVRNSRRLHQAIESINASGQTDIGAALEAGYEIISDAPSRRTAAVLLTDGRNESSTYQNQHDFFAKKHIPVYSIGLSVNADTRLLREISETTGGEFYKAVSNSELLGIYQRIASVISRREVIFSRRIPYTKKKISIPVDNSIKDISFMLDAGLSEVIFKLTSPEGKEYTVAPIKDANFSEIRINKPEAGLWTARISNRASKKPLELNVTGDTALYLDSFPPLQTADAVWLSSTLADNGNPITNANVQVMSKRGRLKLYDDGKHNDNAAEDGVYTCKIPLETEMDLDLLLRAWGSKKEPYIRQTDAGTLRRKIIEVKAPTVNYHLYSDSKAEFPASYAGEDVDCMVDLTYSGTPRQLNAAFTPLKNNVYTIDTDNLQLCTEKISSGNNEIMLKLHIPDIMPEGTYAGNVQLSTPETEITLPVNITITDPELTLSTENLKLGYLKKNSEQECSVRLNLESAQPRTVDIEAENHDFKVNYTPQQITPGKAAEIKFSFISSDLNIGEYQQQNLKIRAGNLEKTLTISYSIAPVGKKREIISMTHEMSLPELSHRITTSLPAHEMLVPQPLPPATETPEKPDTIENKVQAVKELPTITPEVAQEAAAVTDSVTKSSTYNPQEAGLLVILIIVGTLALGIILLILRKLTSKRMLRFALLSATLHLPLIAVIASYIIVTGTHEARYKTKTTVNVVAVTAGEDSGYISANSTILKTFNNDHLPVDKEYTPIDNTATAMIEDTADTLIDNTDSEPLDSQDTTKIAKVNIIPAALSQPEITTPAAEFSFSSLGLDKGAPPKINRDNASDSNPHNTLTSITQPEIPLKEIFAASQETATNTVNPATVLENHGNAVALNEIVEDNTTINQEIDHILAAGPETELPLEKESNNSSVASAVSADILEDIALPELSTTAKITPEQLTETSELKRDLTEGITRTSQLKSISQSLPAAEDPEQLLASIDKTVPPQTGETEYELAIPVENNNDMPTELTALTVDELITDNSHSEDIISEASPKPTLNENELTAETMASTAIEAIPGITANGSCLGLDAINESIRLSRKNDGNTEHELENTFSGIRPNITDDNFAQIKINETPDSEIEAPARKIQEYPQADEITLTETEPAETTTDFAELDKPAVIASLDTLDLTINRKLGRLTAMEGTVITPAKDISRSTTTEAAPQINNTIEQPETPAISRLATAEPDITPAALTRIEELPVSDTRRLDLNNAETEINADTLASERPLAMPPVASAEPVKITNDPQPLNSIVIPGKHLLKAPVSLNGTITADSDSEIENISLNIGILSNTASQHKELMAAEDINMINLENSADIDADILSCQLVITDKQQLSQHELALLKEYISSGGYLWLMNQGIPEEFTALGTIQPITDDDGVFNSVYNINKENILFAEELRSTARRQVIATGIRSADNESPLLINIFSTLLGKEGTGATTAASKQQEFKYTSFTWQNFTGIDNSTLGWKGPKWGNTVTTGIAPDGTGGEALLVDIKAGHEDLTSINYIIPDNDGRRIDLTKSKALILDIYNASKCLISISLGLTTESRLTGWDEFETRRVTLQAGWNRNIVINLDDFRSRRDPHGGYSHRLGAADNCARVSLYFKNIQNGGNLLIDNLRWGQ